MFPSCRLCHVRAKVGLHGWDTPVARQLAHICGLNAEHAMARRLEVGEQGPVIGTYVDDQVFGIQAVKLRDLPARSAKLSRRMRVVPLV